MSTRTSLISLTLLFSWVFSTIGFVRSQAVKPSLNMPQEEAFQILKALNDKNMLFPKSLMGVSGEYKGLLAENCFGLEPIKGWKVAWESTWKNNYGIKFEYAGDPSPTVQVGFLYSSAPFLIAGKPMGSGAYAVLANTGTFQLSGDAGTFHWVRDRQVPDMRTEQITLTNKLDATLFAAKSTGGPTFSLVKEANGVFVTIGANKLAIRKT
jgi:hypothetical protein